MASDGEITYLVETKDSFFKMTLPERYRLTLGPLTPGAKGVSYGTDKLVLRVYDGTKQRGVFHNVVTFRDINIKILGGIMDAQGFVTWEEVAIVSSIPVEREKVEF